MRILVITQYFWPESFRINDLVQALRERHHEIEVLTGMPNYPGGRLYPGYGLVSPATESFEGVTVKRVPLLPRGSSKGWRLALNYASFALFASLLGPWRCKGRYDVIFVYEPSPITVALPGMLLSALKRSPWIFWVQDLWPESLSATGAVKSPFVLRLVRRLVDWIYRRCDLVLVSSRGFTGHALQSGIGKRRVAYLPNWAEALYRPLPAPPEAVAREMPAGFRVMFAGNIGAAQSFETILAAAERLRDRLDIHWVVLGDGDMKEWVAAEVARRGLRKQVHLLGRRPLDTMPGYFAAADALLVTLRADPVFALTVPSKIQSYLACGRPLIAAIGGEGAELVVESGAGVVCPPEDPEKLARAVLDLYEMPAQQRLDQGRKGRDYFVANFDREMLLDRLERWMSDVAGAGRCAS